MAGSKNLKGFKPNAKEKIFVRMGRGHGYLYQIGEIYFKVSGPTKELNFRIRGSTKKNANFLRELRLHLKEVLEKEGYVVGFKQQGGSKL